MNVHWACLEWDFLWSVTKREKSNTSCHTLWSINSLIDHSRGKQTWEGRPINVSETEEILCVVLQVCVRLCVLTSKRLPCILTVQPCVYHAYWSDCVQESLCEIVCFPHLRKDNVVHSTREQSHYRSRNSSLEATALHVVWVDRASFSPRRAVQHTLCHYQCPAVHTSLQPAFSWEKVDKTTIISIKQK